MCVRVCVRMCICVHVRMCAHMCARVHMCVRVIVCARVHVSARWHVLACASARVSVYVCVCVLGVLERACFCACVSVVHVCMYMSVCARLYVYARMCV